MPVVDQGRFRPFGGHLTVFLTSSFMFCLANSPTLGLFQLKNVIQYVFLNKFYMVKSVDVFISKT